MAQVVALYHRYNGQGDRIRTTRVTYLVTRLGGRWGIQARFGAGEPHDSEVDGMEAEAAALEAVDLCLTAFYRSDSSDWASTLSYPYVNVRVGVLDEIKTKDDATRFDRARLDPQLEVGIMTWKALRVIQSGTSGINVAVELTRKDRDGKILDFANGLYLVTCLHGHWGVTGRSVIAR
jgi:hypothetical protein